jgi:hypothetical protein
MTIDPFKMFDIVGVSDRRRVNLCLHVWLGWCVKMTQGCMLVRAECPYVQSLLLALLALKFGVGLQTGARGMKSQVSDGWILER